MANGDDPKKKKWSYSDLQKASSLIKTPGILRGAGAAVFTIKGLDAAGFTGWKTIKGQKPAGPRKGGPSNLATDYVHKQPNYHSSVNPEDVAYKGEISLAGNINEEGGVGSFISARQSPQGFAEDLFNQLTGHKKFEGVSGEKGISGYSTSNVSKINPRSGKSFLQGIPYARLYNSESSTSRKKAMNERLTKVVTEKANLALHGSKDKTIPVFKKDASKDFNPYPNLDMSTQTTEGGPTFKPWVDHVVTTPQSGKKKKKNKRASFSYTGNLIRRIAEPFKKTGVGLQITKPNRFKIF